MSAHPLFSNVWSLKELLAPYDSLPSRSKMSSVFQTQMSQNLLPTSVSAGMNANVVRSVLAVAGQLPLADCNMENLGVIKLSSAGTASDVTWYAAEMDNSDGTAVVVSFSINWETKETNLSGVMVSAGSQRFTPLKALPATVRKNVPWDFLPVYLVMMYVAADHFSEFSTIFEDACSKARTLSSSADLQNLTGPFFQLSHALYALFNSDKGYSISMPGGNIPVLQESEIRNSLFADAPLVFGHAPYLKGTSSGVLDPKTFGQARAEFSSWVTRKSWSAEEEALIPQFPDDFPILPESLKLARRYVQTHTQKRPMVNFLWRGITSFGKSTGVEVIAALLHTPLVRMTCHSTMETQNFLSEFVPDNGTSFVGKVPTVEEMYLDPEGCYTAITGEEKGGATAEDCLHELLQRTAKNNGTAKFKHVESNFVKAMAKGWICEIQEISRIRDPGVLVGLNEYDRPNAVIPLVDGNYVRRHKDAMCIYTDNVGYASCRPVDPSVIRRMAVILDSNDLPRDKVLERVKYNTGMRDRALLTVLYRTWKAVAKYCKEHEITEGSVSVTELEMWASCVLADDGANLRESCLECVVAKATSDPDEQKEIDQAVLSVNLANI